MCSDEFNALPLFVLLKLMFDSYLCVCGRFRRRRSWTARSCTSATPPHPRGAPRRSRPPWWWPRPTRSSTSPRNRAGSTRLSAGMTCSRVVDSGLQQAPAVEGTRHLPPSIASCGLWGIWDATWRIVKTEDLNDRRECVSLCRQPHSEFSYAVSRLVVGCLCLPRSATQQQRPFAASADDLDRCETYN